MSRDPIGVRWPLLAGAGSALSCIGTLLMLLLWPIWAPLMMLSHGLGWWPQRRSLTLEGGDYLVLDWSGSNPHGRESLAAAVDLLAEIVARTMPETEVETLEFLNPENGMFIPEVEGQVIRSPFGQNALDLLWKGKMENGVLRVNGSRRFEGLDVEARSSMAGQISLEIPRLPAAGELRAIALEYGYEVPRTA